MAKRSTPRSDDTPATRRRARTTAVPGPAGISIPVPIAAVDDMSGPTLTETIPVAAPAPAPPSSDEIAQRAYELFEADGRRHGRDIDHWLAAENELKHPRPRR